MMTPDQIAIAKGLLLRGDKQHDIAAFFRVNGGRIAELSTGQTHADIAPAAPKDLPSPEEVSGDYQWFTAELAIRKAMKGLQRALAVIEDARAARP